MVDELQIIPLDQQRLSDVQRLAKLAFNVEYTLEHLSHKYNTADYCGQQFLCCIGYINNDPVAFYGGIPQVYFNHYSRESILLVQTCDSYTLPGYQGKGLHKRLALASYELMKAQGVKAVFALHSENTFESCKRLDWQLQCELLLFQIEKKNGIPWLKILDKFRFLNTFSSKRVLRIITNHFSRSSTFNNEHCKEGFGAHYSKEFIEYKNKYRCFIIELAGCKLWLRIKSVVYIGAIENITEENVDAVLDGLEVLLKLLGTDKVFIELHPRHTASRILRTRLKSKNAYKVGYKCLDSNFDFNNVVINYSDLDSFM